MRKFAGLKIDENEASQNPVVEDKINPKMLFLERKPYLPADKNKPLAHLKNKLLDIPNDPRFKFRFAVTFLLLKTKEFKNVWIFNDIFRLRNNLSTP